MTDSISVFDLTKSHPHPHLLISRHFDKEKSGRLNHQEFKSCLRSLGYDLPMVEEGEPDPEFEAILDTVDPNRCVTSFKNYFNTDVQCNRFVFCCICCLTVRSVFAGTATCHCRNTWRSWSAARRRTSNPVRRSRAPSELWAQRTNHTSLKRSSTRSDVFSALSVGSVGVSGLHGGLTVPFSLSEPDQGAGRLLPVTHEALPRQQGPRAAVSVWLCRIHPLALCQLIPRPPVTNRDAFSHTHFNMNTWLKLHDCGTRNTH